MREAQNAAMEIGFPLVIRPSYTLGGTGGGFVMKAEDFDMKLSKLAGRMDNKGFKSEIKVTSEHVGVNFSCWVTDGELTAHAYTIIASGPIVRPHYRYLVK